MIDKETKSSLYILETLLEEKGLSLTIHNPNIDIIDNKYYVVIKKVQAILNNDKLDDFLKIDEIVKLFLENNIDTDCHDF